MKTYYKNDLKKAYLILEGEKSDKDDYRIEMLRENEIPGLLKMDARYVDNVRHYQYDISGKVSLKAIHEKMNLTCKDMRQLVEQLLKAVKTVRKYMLDGNEILLDPEYIFCTKERYFFCYYPSGQRELQTEFHKLTEFFVREVNYKDKEGVHFAYTLHKATMEENYSIEQILEELSYEEKEEIRVSPSVPLTYTERMENKELEEVLIAEKREMWEPVRRLLERRKKGKWGYWDDFQSNAGES